MSMMFFCSSQPCKVLMCDKQDCADCMVHTVHCSAAIC